jgi:hypothetical protein
LGSKVKSWGAKSSKKGGRGMITMLLLVTNLVVVRDVCAGTLSWWSNAAHTQIFG